jgi:hypothetical protein
MRMVLPGRLISWTREGRFGVVQRAYAYKRGEVIVWIDPFMPDERSRVAVEAFGRPHHVVLTSGSHDRDTEAVRARYGIPAWVPAVEGGDRRVSDPEHRYTWQTELPAGLRAVHIPGVGAGEHAVVGDVDGRRFAFVGDAVMHHEKPGFVARLVLRRPRGDLQHKAFFPGGAKRTALKEAKRLLSLELEMLFPTIGTPITHDARGKLRESLSAWA